MDVPRKVFDCGQEMPRKIRDGNCVIETKAKSILDFIHGMRGELQDL